MKKRETFRRRIIFVLSLALPLALLVGCAAQGPQLQTDSFFDEWRLLAEESRGFSPDAERETVDLGEIIERVDDIAPPEPERPLPVALVNLRLRDAPITSILRALARIADQNIIVNPTITGQTSVNLRNVPWDQAFRGLLATHGLAYGWEGDIIRIMTVEDMEHELRLAAVQERKGAHRIEIGRVAPLNSQIIRINYANAEELAVTLLNMLTKDAEGKVRGSVAVDRHSNALVVQSTLEDLERIGRMITILDRPRPQVLIEATIVEATQDVARELGIQWSGRYLARGPDGAHHGVTSSLDPTDLADPFGVVDTIIGGRVDADGNPIASTLGLMIGRQTGTFLNMQLRALQQQGKIKILSQPSITTMDNQMAYTENGTRIPVVTISDGDRTVRYEDAVLRLEITPNVIDSKNLKMKIAVKKDEVDMSRQVDGNPFIIKKQTETNLNVANGETIVISGLTKQQITDASSGIPGLKDVDGLGRLFRVDRKGNAMEEVLIFLTPTILPKR